MVILDSVWVVFDDKEYISRDDFLMTLLLNVAALGILMWWVLRMFYLQWKNDYLHKVAKVPEDKISADKICKDAKEILDMIEEQAKFVLHDTDMSRNPNLYNVRKNPKAFLNWIGWQHMQSIVWFLYSIGLGIQIFRLPHEDWCTSPPPEDVDEVHKWSKQRRTFAASYDGSFHYSILLVLAFSVIAVGVSVSKKVEPLVAQFNAARIRLFSSLFGHLF